MRLSPKGKIKRSGLDPSEGSRDFCLSSSLLTLDVRRGRPSQDLFLHLILRREPLLEVLPGRGHGSIIVRRSFPYRGSKYLVFERYVVDSKRFENHDYLPFSPGSGASASKRPERAGRPGSTQNDDRQSEPAISQGQSLTRHKTRGHIEGNPGTPPGFIPCRIPSG